MAAPIPTQEPETLVAGDTAKWQRTLSDYPADQSWVLAYTLVSSVQRYTFSATASGSDHLVIVSAATTVNWVAGNYTWRAQVSKAGEVYTVGQGQITIKSSFASATDARSSARTALDNINAYLSNSGNLSAAKYEIAGRMLQRYTIAELISLRSLMQADVAAEDAAQRVSSGLPDKRRVFVRFQPPY